MILFPSGTRVLVPLAQVNLRKEPLAEQVRTTVLLCSMASGRSDLMVTSETGSGTRENQNLPPASLSSTAEHPAAPENVPWTRVLLDQGLLDCFERWAEPSRAFEKDAPRPGSQRTDLLDRFPGFW